MRECSRRVSASHQLLVVGDRRRRRGLVRDGGHCGDDTVHPEGEQCGGHPERLAADAHPGPADVARRQHDVPGADVVDELVGEEWAVVETERAEERVVTGVVAVRRDVDDVVGAQGRGDIGGRGPTDGCLHRHPLLRHPVSSPQLPLSSLCRIRIFAFSPFRYPT